MQSHELARHLLAAPDYPVATQANNHEYRSGIHGSSHGPLKIALDESGYGGPHVVIGNISTRGKMAMLVGDAPVEWKRWD